MASPEAYAPPPFFLRGVSPLWPLYAPCGGVEVLLRWARGGSRLLTLIGCGVTPARGAGALLAPRWLRGETDQAPRLLRRSRAWTTLPGRWQGGAGELFGPQGAGLSGGTWAISLAWHLLHMWRP